jgi:2-polyprenyl-6-methoxyphenol hydroxylase-like FAD-dependent oxidoreductase
MTTSDAPRALIIGGSLGGLFAATTLRAIGWQVDIFERSPHDLDSRRFDSPAYSTAAPSACSQATGSTWIATTESFNDPPCHKRRPHGTCCTVR